jgi:ubiquinol-cytochrome c reductase cytochrome b/c1 subunit
MAGRPARIQLQPRRPLDRPAHAGVHHDAEGVRDFPTPRNFNYFWNFGALAMINLMIMIVTGIFLAMHYTAAYQPGLRQRRAHHARRELWLADPLRARTAPRCSSSWSYVHIWRGMYYGSYKAPRELLWMLGVVIFLLMMATAFMGYVLPWGQMSFWGATVITNLFSAIPLVGNSIVTCCGAASRSTTPR